MQMPQTTVTISSTVSISGFVNAEKSAEPIAPNQVTDVTMSDEMQLTPSTPVPVMTTLYTSLHSQVESLAPLPNSAFRTLELHLRAAMQVHLIRILKVSWKSARHAGGVHIACRTLTQPLDHSYALTSSRLFRSVVAHEQHIEILPASSLSGAKMQ